MNAIELKLKHEQLNVIIAALNKVSADHPKDNHAKFVQSILIELNQKLSKKNIDKHNAKKPFKLSIKYYQGFALHTVMYIVAQDKTLGDYENNVGRIIFNEIDRQL